MSAGSALASIPEYTGTWQPTRSQVTLRIGGALVYMDFPYIPVLTPVLEEGWLIPSALWPIHEAPTVDLLAGVEFLSDFISAWYVLYLR